MDFKSSTYLRHGDELKLNLGCGKVLFPWTPEKEATRHPMLMLPKTAYEADWRNVDALAMPGVDEVVDLFAYPWPWADNSVDEIWASHLIEHIPHAPRRACSHASDNPWATAALTDAQYHKAERWRELEHLDGFYAFFAEVYRVLKPGGIIGICAPYGKSDGALYDPQHTRFITETTFHYLGNGGGNSPTYDYNLPLNFEVTYGPMLDVNSPFDRLPAEQVTALLVTNWNIASTIRAELRAAK